MDLDEVGERQASAIATHVLSAGAIDRVVASPLRRTQRSAEAFGLPVETDERWIELSYGEYEGVPQRDIPSEVWQRWMKDPAFAPPGGESLAAVDARTMDACSDLAEEATERNIVVVSHVSPIKAAVGWALGVGIEVSWRCHLDQASASRIGFRGQRPVLRTFNETVEVE